MEIAIVTGASKGLGRALAEGLVRSGWSLVIDARNEQALRAAETGLRAQLEPGARMVAISGDVTSGLHRRALVEAAWQLGGLDLVVNNASSLGDTPLPGLVDYHLDGLRSVLEANVIAPVALFQDAADLLRNSSNPRLLNITSDASVEHYEGWGGYGMAKAAFDHATVTLGVREFRAPLMGRRSRRPSNRYASAGVPGRGHLRPPPPGVGRPGTVGADSQRYAERSVQSE